MVLALAGCSSAADPNDAGKPFSGQTLNVFNWSDYIDPELIPEFERRTGARVQYDNYASESELESKLLSGGGGYDVVFPSDRSLAPLIRKGLLEELDHARLTNWKNLDPRYLDPAHDPGNKHSVPYFWGTIAVGVRTDHVAEAVKGFDVLFDERYKGRITMLDDPENVVAVSMLHLGLPMNSTEDADLAKVADLLKAQAPLVQAWTSDMFKEKLIKGEAWVSLGWSGDILQAREADKNVMAIVPESGTLLWVDSVAIPKDVKNRDLAYAFIDFLLELEIAARNANAVKYASPNAAARAKIDPAMLADPAVYPPDEVLKRCQWLQDRGPAIRKIERVWADVRK